MRNAQKIWKLIQSMLVIEVRHQDRLVIAKSGEVILSCPKFFYMSDEELDMLLKDSFSEG